MLDQCGALSCRLTVDAWDENLNDSTLRIIATSERGKDLASPKEQMERDQQWWHPRAKIRVSGNNALKSGYLSYKELWRRKHGARALLLQQLHAAAAKYDWGLTPGQVLAFVGGGDKGLVTVMSGGTGNRLTFPDQRWRVRCTDLRRALKRSLEHGEGERIMDAARVELAKLLKPKLVSASASATVKPVLIADSEDSDALLQSSILATEMVAAVSTRFQLASPCPRLPEERARWSR